MTQTKRAWFGAVEVLSALALLVAAWGFYRFYVRAEPVIATAWGALGFIALIALSRRAWVRLLGPVLFYELVRLARRNRYFLLRLLYVAAVSALLYWQYDDFLTKPRTVWGPGPARFSSQGIMTVSQGAEFAEQFFNKFMVFQFALVLLLTPIYTAGAIAEEKDRKTLEFILATDLASREIVLSKLFSRLANLSLIVMTGLPIVSLMQFLGGVDPDLLLASFAALALTITSVAALSILFSVYSRKPRDAILLTYLAVAAYIGIGILGQMLISSPAGKSALGPELTALVDGYNSGNLPVVLYKLRQAIISAPAAVAMVMVNQNGTIVATPMVVTAAPALSSIIPPFLRNFAIFHGLLILIATTWAVYRFRAVVLRQPAVATSRTLRAKRHFLRPRVGRLPMVWKELFVEPGFRLTRMGRFVVALLVLITLIPAGWICWNEIEQILINGSTIRWGTARLSRWDQLGDKLNFWVRITGTAVATLLLLAVAMRASTSIGGERDRDTLDGLLMSPLQSKDILFAKWLGSLMSARWGWIWLGGIWAIGWFTGAMNHAAILLSIAAWLVYASTLAGVGIWYSLACRTTLRATMCTLAMTAFISAGQWGLWMCCLPFGPTRTPFWSGGSYNGYWAYGFSANLEGGFAVLSPPAVLYRLSATTSELHGSEWEMGTLAAYFGIFLWTIAAVFLWSLTRRRFRQMTARMPHRTPTLMPRGTHWIDPWEAREG
jgi:ABC-type transport system involved in multi-copper enzyme maturation permease subunit